MYYGLDATKDLCIYRIIWVELQSIKKHIADALQKKFPDKSILCHVSSCGSFDEDGEPRGGLPDWLDIYFKVEGEKKEISVSFIDVYFQKPLLRFREECSVHFEQRLHSLGTVFTEKMTDVLVSWLQEGVLRKEEIKAIAA